MAIVCRGIRKKNLAMLFFGARVAYKQQFYCGVLSSYVFDKE